MGLGMCGGVVVIEGKGALCEVSDSAEGGDARWWRGRKTTVT